MRASLRESNDRDLMGLAFGLGVCSLARRVCSLEKALVGGIVFVSRGAATVCGILGICGLGPIALVAREGRL